MKTPNDKTLSLLREKYPAGTRIELILMNDKQAPSPGTRGTVQGVDDAGDLLVRWDNGSGLKIRVITTKCGSQGGADGRGDRL